MMLPFRHIHIKRTKGFSLVEIMVALSVFIVVMVISLGSITGIFEANRKSRSLKAVLDNLNFTLESMTREMRFGKNYHCDVNVTPVSSPRDCAGGGSSVSFRSSDDIQISYRRSGNVIEKSVGGGSFIPVTAPEVTITHLTYYVLGSASYASGDTNHPWVLILIKGYAGENQGTRTEFTLQTRVSQRSMDR